jgi:N-acetylglucosamine-6-phosphate deacetylase
MAATVATTALLVAGGRAPDAEALDVLVRDGLIAGAGPGLAAPAAAAVDATALTVAPGLIDIQVNGAAGIDLTHEPERVWEVAAALPRFGVTAFLPTIVSAPAVRYERALAALAGGPPRGWEGARPLGWHFEGPMLSPRRPGAHEVRHLRRPDPRVYEGWSRERGVAMVTLAPELPGALAAVAALAARGVVVAAGHTEASAAEMRAAADRGVRYATHLFNAMAPLGHREPGPVGAVLAGLPVVAGLIADGAHLDPAVVALVWRALGPERCNLVSDAVAALGAGRGGSRLGDLDLVAGEDGVRRPDGTLAGSALGLDTGLRNLSRFTGCPLAAALATVTSTPAALLGRPDLGAIAPGMAGDLTLLDRGLGVAMTVVGGRVLHRAPGGGGSRF